MIRLAMSVGRIYLLTCAVLYWQQGRFIFIPSRTVEETPADYQLAFEEVWLPIPTSKKQSERLHGWWIPAQAKNAQTLLYFHGNGVNIGANTEQAKRFHKLGFSVFLFDYRGYGKSGLCGCSTGLGLSHARAEDFPRKYCALWAFLGRCDRDRSSYSTPECGWADCAKLLYFGVGYGSSELVDCNFSGPSNPEPAVYLY
jgi:pimeloyl-ACP methyl ester carboxylesterase